jgi:hypothetical protein
VNISPLEAALRYAGWGWAIFPCHEPIQHECSCGHGDCASPAKHPRTRRGLHDATTDPDRVVAWWHRWPSANIGVRTGSNSGLVIIDIDHRPGGDVALVALERAHGALPRTATVETGAGRHYWFAHPGGTIRNSVSRLGPGIDVRADGGYVIAPPSSHITGRRYRWTAAQSVAPLPDWIFHTVQEPHRRIVQPAETSQSAQTQTGPWARAALTAELMHVRYSVPGARNDALNRAAFALGQLVGGGRLRAEDVSTALQYAGMSCGLSPREVRATVASGLHAGIRMPRDPGRASRYPW